MLFSPKNVKGLHTLNVMLSERSLHVFLHIKIQNEHYNFNNIRKRDPVQTTF